MKDLKEEFKKSFRSKSCFGGFFKVQISDWLYTDSVDLEIIGDVNFVQDIGSGKTCISTRKLACNKVVSESDLELMKDVIIKQIDLDLFYGLRNLKLKFIEENPQTKEMYFEVPDEMKPDIRKLISRI